jgi:hypothetical protein
MTLTPRATTTKVARSALSKAPDFGAQMTCQNLPRGSRPVSPQSLLGHRPESEEEEPIPKRPTDGFAASDRT